MLIVVTTKNTICHVQKGINRYSDLPINIPYISMCIKCIILYIIIYSIYNACGVPVFSLCHCRAHTKIIIIITVIIIMCNVDKMKGCLTSIRKVD